MVKALFSWRRDADPPDREILSDADAEQRYRLERDMAAAQAIHSSMEQRLYGRAQQGAVGHYDPHQYTSGGHDPHDWTRNSPTDAQPVNRSLLPRPRI